MKERLYSFNNLRETKRVKMRRAMVAWGCVAGERHWLNASNRFAINYYKEHLGSLTKAA